MSSSSVDSSIFSYGVMTGGRRTLARGVGFWRKRRGLRFDNAALRELPVDSEPRNFVRSRVVGACLSRVLPTPLANPQLVIAAKEPLALVGIDLLDRRGDEEGGGEDNKALPIDELTPLLAGNALFDGSEPTAQCYCGHQFGYFSGQLGDGAAISLGEAVLDDAGKEGAERWEMQLKGAGKTPYSRQADGRKVLVSKRAHRCPAASIASDDTSNTSLCLPYRNQY